MPADACVAPAPTERASNSRTCAPRRASSHATAQPITPAPITIAFFTDDSSRRVQVLLLILVVTIIYSGTFNRDSHNELGTSNRDSHDEIGKRIASSIGTASNRPCHALHVDSMTIFRTTSSTAETVDTKSSRNPKTTRCLSRRLRTHSTAYHWRC